MTVSQRCCFVHIGAPRTGSTALEKYFHDHRNALLEQGLLYPDAALRGYGHHDVAFLLSGGYPDWAITQPRSLDELGADLRNAVQNHPGDVLISSENFYLFPAVSALRALLDSSGLASGRRVVIVVYLRRQDEAQESWYNQTVKAQGSTLEIAESVRRWRDLWDYRAQLAEWSSVFGAENIRVRLFEEKNFEGGSLAADFFAAIGKRDSRLPPVAERINAHVNRDILEFQRLVNRLPLQTIEKRRFLRQLSDLNARAEGAGLFDQRTLLDVDQRRAILSNYAAGNAEVASRFFGRETLFAPLAGNDTPATKPYALTTDKLAYILGWLMSASGSEKS